ncbi:PilZ domain-containing protein [Sphingobium sp.]|uniref:PilZ domain-containing protein n=1 Tax=Sphingobium sp. TaxID=1912891 RepID=UPI003B3BE0D3
MSSAIQAKLLTNRRASDRRDVQRMSTMRTEAQVPADIIINDLSVGGCRISGDLDLALDDRVTIGLPGLGARPAHVVWAKDGSTGLLFDQVLTGHDVTVTREANTLITGRFNVTGAMLADPSETAEPQDESRLSPASRLGIIVTAALLAWALAIAMIWLGSRIV